MCEELYSESIEECSHGIGVTPIENASKMDLLFRNIIKSIT